MNNQHVWLVIKKKFITMPGHINVNFECCRSFINLGSKKTASNLYTLNAGPLIDMFYSTLYYFILHPCIVFYSSQNFTKYQQLVPQLHTVLLNVFIKV